MKYIRFIFFIFSLFTTSHVFAYKFTSILAGDPVSVINDNKITGCKELAAARIPNQPQSAVVVVGDYCRVYQLDFGVITEDTTCPANVTTKPISVPGWTSWGLEQTDAYYAKIASSTVCYQGCKYKNPSMTGTDGSDLMSLSYKDPVKDASCPNTTTKPDTIPPDNSPQQPTCKNASGSDAYCTKPPTGCPSGYSQGSYNGQTICIKNSTNNPNPNDPNNDPKDPQDPKDPNSGDLKGVIDAINNAKNELKSAIQAQANQLSSAIQQQTDALKESINAQTSAITSSVSNSANSIKESLSNGFKSVTDSLGITNSKIDTTNNKLDQINSSNNQIKENINTTNRKLDELKDVSTQTNQNIESLKSSQQETNRKLEDIKNNSNETNNKLNEINQNGKNGNDKLSDINSNGKETNKNLQDLKDGQKETNGILKSIKSVLDDIKKFLTDESDLPQKEDLPERKIDKQSLTTSLFSASAQCPSDKTLYLMSVTYTYSYSDICYYLKMLGYLIMTFAYLWAARIVSNA